MSNEIKTATEVVTWADGHGRWHVTVPDTPMGLSRAVRSLALEITDRNEVTFLEARHYVEEHLVSLPSEEPGRVHFAEYSI